ncbi:tail fiber assembly protein, partial [Escherichia coli]
FRLPGVTFFCISDTLVPTTYLVDTTLSNSSDSDQTVQAVRLPTEEETPLLEAWKKYRMLLNRVDTSTAPDIEWPTNPVRE